jgi:hypothetical protein
MKKLLIISCFVMGCGPVPDRSHIDGDAPNDGWRRINDISYLMDKRTKLCFASISVDRSASIATVPCSDEVMKLIKNY